MTITITVTQDDINTALGTFLQGVLPTGVEVIVGQVNRAPEPASPNFVVMWPTLRSRLSTNVETTTFDSTSGAGINTLSQPTQVTVQCDVHGPASAENAQILSTLLRSSYGVDTVSALNANVTPLYCEDPRQVPFINAEQALETRWIVDAILQVNMSVVVPQQSANVVAVDVINVEATYP